MVNQRVLALHRGALVDLQAPIVVGNQKPFITVAVQVGEAHAVVVRVERGELVNF